MNYNFIQELNKFDMSYNPYSLNYLNNMFKLMMLENSSEDKSLIR